MRIVMTTPIAALLVLVAAVAAAAETEYRPGPPAFSYVWGRFYTSTPHEPELMDPLIEAGPKMTQAICEAVLHKDMMYRRYAIGALGFIGDRGALPTLERIINDGSEKDYFRGDALQAVYHIDKVLGRRRAEQYLHGPEYLKMISEAIKRNEQWLTERPREH